jgi:hypothetical protein
MGQDPPLRAITYKDLQHPADLDGEPREVASQAIRDLGDGSSMFGRQVYAVVQQIRSGFMSEQLDRDKELTPERLGELWDASDEALACVRLMRAMKATGACVRELRELSSDQA